MNTFFLVLAIIFGLLTLASLVAGIAGMTGGGTFNERYGNRLMRGRILFQVLAIACLFGAVAA